MTGKPATSSVTQAGEVRSARIESLRALAALAVLSAHVYAYSHAARGDDYGSLVLQGGIFGVFLFFALSGYLLFWPFARRYFADGGEIDLGTYAVNRALRILPLYYVVVVFVLLVQESGASTREWALFLTFSESFASDTLAQVNGVLWSLVVELHFYALLPLLAWGLARMSGGSRERAALILAVLGAASVVLRYLTVKAPDAPNLIWAFSFPTTFFYFVPGMLIALLRLAWDERAPSWLGGRVALGDAWLLASIPVWALVLLIFDYQFDLLSAVASFLVVGACVLPLRPGPLVRALGWRALALLGIASYSLYLWHLPVLEALTGGVGRLPYGYLELFAIALPLSCAVALASYATIESPFLRLRRRWARGPRAGIEPSAKASG